MVSHQAIDGMMAICECSSNCGATRVRVCMIDLDEWPLGHDSRHSRTLRGQCAAITTDQSRPCHPNCTRPLASNYNYPLSLSTTVIYRNATTRHHSSVYSTPNFANWPAYLMATIFAPLISASLTEPTLGWTGSKSRQTGQREPVQKSLCCLESGLICISH